MYHCYFLINYIGPPKVCFLSFGPHFKKFAHHWAGQWNTQKSPAYAHGTNDAMHVMIMSSRAFDFEHMLYIKLCNLSEHINLEMKSTNY